MSSDAKVRRLLSNAVARVAEFQRLSGSVVTRTDCVSLCNIALWSLDTGQSQLPRFCLTTAVVAVASALTTTAVIVSA